MRISTSLSLHTLQDDVVLRDQDDEYDVLVDTAPWVYTILYRIRKSTARGRLEDMADAWPVGPESLERAGFNSLRHHEACIPINNTHQPPPSACFTGPAHNLV